MGSRSKTLPDDLRKAVEEFEKVNDISWDARRDHVGARADLEAVTREILTQVKLLDGMNPLPPRRGRRADGGVEERPERAEPEGQGGDAGGGSGDPGARAGRGGEGGVSSRRGGRGPEAVPGPPSSAVYCPAVAPFTTIR